MSSAIRIALCSALLCLLIGCQPPPPKIVNNDISPGIGPFDSRGRYREDWADDPSKWRRPVATPPPVASNTRPSTSTSSLDSCFPVLSFFTDHSDHTIDGYWSFFYRNM